MKTKTTLCILAALSAVSLTVNAATIVVDNLDLPTPVTTGAQSNYQMQSFTPAVAGIGTSDTVAANSPLPATVFLESVRFLTTPTGTGSTLGPLFVDVYTGTGNSGAYVGSSSNSVDVAATPFNTTIQWTFANLPLISESTYSFVFSTDAIVGSPATARLTAANNGGGFVNTYNGGIASANASGTPALNFDTRFQARLNTVPEPSSALLGGFGVFMLGLLRRRRC